MGMFRAGYSRASRIERPRRILNDAQDYSLVEANPVWALLCFSEGKRAGPVSQQDLFRVLSSVLNLKSELERKREQPRGFRRAWAEDSRIHFLLNEAVGDDVIGRQQRVNANIHRICPWERRAALFCAPRHD
jgi:hypothetical protein